MKGATKAQYFEHAAGDATASVFERQEQEEPEDKSIHSFKVAMQIIKEAENKRISPTRCGLFSGKVIEAKINGRKLMFGNCFSAASRLQKLCDFFDTPVLMDKNVALAQKEDKEFITCVGKVTPKSLDHPIHIFTIYKPGINKIPENVNQNKLRAFIALKNQGIEYFHGNDLKQIKPDFTKARKKLFRASNLLKEITGHEDIAAERVLSFIEEKYISAEKFLSEGMKFTKKVGYYPKDLGLFRLGRELLMALDQDLYENFIKETRWQKWFQYQWRDEGETIFKKGDPPDGVYFLIKGSVSVANEKGRVIDRIAKGDIFGEMAYFEKDKSRTATIIAHTDIEYYFISGANLREYPQIYNLLKRIAKYRKLNKKGTLKRVTGHRQSRLKFPVQDTSRIGCEIPHTVQEQRTLAC